MAGEQFTSNELWNESYYCNRRSSFCSHSDITLTRFNDTLTQTNTHVHRSFQSLIHQASTPDRRMRKDNHVHVCLPHQCINFVGASRSPSSPGVCGRTQRKSNNTKGCRAEFERLRLGSKLLSTRSSDRLTNTYENLSRAIHPELALKPSHPMSHLISSG